MDLFHRLGLASHPNAIRAQLQSAASHFDSKILVWKDKIESTRKQEKLLPEVLFSQTGCINAQNDDMEICSVDFSHSTLQKFKYFDEVTYESCKEILPPGSDVYEDTDLMKAVKLLKDQKLPLYRWVK